ncbi:hypothetical protein BRADI_1g67083v3 [Brachypodium distachyon]|uniref:Uncharacterized protein n=1 Tax=Brachypodium distachyon TaxID=15368 RepID=A0A0Q3JYB9_BRADI|nr:hypothetical protein BRADI_1g67083v3 [Brachypodium distachyon]
MKGVAKRMAAPSFYEFTTSGEWRRGRRLLLLRCPFRSLQFYLATSRKNLNEL